MALPTSKRRFLLQMEGTGTIPGRAFLPELEGIRRADTCPL
jgi:hypothetical protein